MNLSVITSLCSGANYCLVKIYPFTIQFKPSFLTMYFIQTIMWLRSEMTLPGERIMLPVSPPVDVCCLSLRLVLTRCQPGPRRRQPTVPHHVTPVSRRGEERRGADNSTPWRAVMSPYGRHRHTQLNSAELS